MRDGRAEDVDGIVAFARREKIDLVVVGPEAPLVKAWLIGSRRRRRNFGPSAKAAELEGSKGFMKDIAAKYGIPTARYARFADRAKAKNFAGQLAPPIVIKADGLAAGKGVVICATLAEAEAEIDAMLQGAKFRQGFGGDRGRGISRRRGAELLRAGGRCACATAGFGAGSQAGRRWRYRPQYRRHGCLLPHPVATKAVERRSWSGSSARPSPAWPPRAGRSKACVRRCHGTKEGPKLIEFNVRFGDPECQAIMLRMNRICCRR